ncbi:hypothetical protein NitYY0826_C0857 [Nitratiruptor sp. YY08-26]|nr:hypothetical protein NitYY0813_C0855 [Nitratiruptor sp. YY08-13]BCD65925.1 hypothetical protein NitYY0826_C0857 [Nitratiruptor sp. YY08-26]
MSAYYGGIGLYKKFANLINLAIMSLHKNLDQSGGYNGFGFGEKTRDYL